MTRTKHSALINNTTFIQNLLVRRTQLIIIKGMPQISNNISRMLFSSCDWNH